jgi:ribosomal protein S18 acetylase RimI-like enzyme
MRSDLMLVKLDLATAVDRARLGRIRGPRAMRHFVHWNWFWLDRALSDAAISMFLLRTGPRNGIIGCLALGPHERVDLDPASRVWTLGELFHLVIDARYTGRGYGRAATEAAIVELGARLPAMTAVRVAHHEHNTVAAHLYEGLGFVVVGEKVDAETGIRDVLRERPVMDQSSRN